MYLLVRRTCVALNNIKKCFCTMGFSFTRLTSQQKYNLVKSYVIKCIAVELLFS